MASSIVPDSPISDPNSGPGLPGTDDAVGQRPPVKSVQQYIDETPIWMDGTATDQASMTHMQWRIWLLATAGKFFEGLVVFMTGVALPLIVRQFGLDAVGKGVVTAAPLLGILVGATALGGLSDYFGRKCMFIVEMILFVAFLTLLAVSPTFIWLVIGLFGTGMALGCDYPTAHTMISESVPSRIRGRLVLGAFAFQAVGALVGTVVGYLVLYENPALDAWRWMYVTAILPAVLVVLGRFFVSRSAPWLLWRGRVEEAERETLRLLARRPAYPRQVKLAPPEKSEGGGADEASFASLFSSKHRRATILASVPWFLQDLSTYGIGIFTPTILASVIGAHDSHAHNLAALIHEDMLAAKGAAFVDIFLLLGMLGAVVFADILGRMRLQIIGFVGCGVALAVATLSLGLDGPLKLVLMFAGFALFNFLTNLGPNAMTYLVAGEVFPVQIRGKGAGLAASIAKVGAVTTAFLFPILLKDFGASLLLWGLVGTSLLGALCTWAFRIETKGVRLDEIRQEA